MAHFSSPVIRPGVSTESLSVNEIRNVLSSEAFELVGASQAGILIPYRNLEGRPLIVNDRPFARLRRSAPGAEPRYLSPAGGGCQLFVPLGLLPLLSAPSEILFICEGEFKALALVEAGFPAVGVGGITSICPRDPSTKEPTLLPALSELLRRFSFKKLAFVGDSDTALIPDFAREAVKLAGLSAISVMLPRIPFDAPGKAPDDLKECWGKAFNEKWRQIVEESESVAVDCDPGQLALRLLRREQEAVRRHLTLKPDTRGKIEKRFLKLVAAFSSSPLTADDLISVCCVCLGARRNAFVKAVNDLKRRNSEELASSRTLNFRQLLAPDEKSPVLVFDGRDYWRRDGDRMVSIRREDARLHLAADLQLSCIGEKGGLSEVDQALFFVQREFACDYAGPLCGRSPGLLFEDGMRILVTTGPTVIPTAPGGFPTISRLLLDLFGISAKDRRSVLQYQLFCWWLKVAREAVLNPSRHLPGQVLGLIGPPDCGKSFLQKALITPALGGRSINPTAALLGRTNFNEDLWGAEHLALGDESLSEHGRDRKRLREEIKKIVASPDYWRHGKFRNGIQLRPIWRVSVSANDDPESISALPTLDGSFEDKVIYLLCYAPPMPFFDASVSGARAAFSEAIRNELPAFLDSVDKMSIPPNWAHARFGIRAWHHPTIVELLKSSSPLSPLVEALEIWRRERAPKGRTLSATELYQELASLLPAGITSIANGPARLGRLLAQLAVEPEWRGKVVRSSHRLGPNNQRQALWEIRFE